MAEPGGGGARRIEGLGLFERPALQQETRGVRQEYLDILQARLVSAFRRYSFLPAAAFLHLALTSLDLARLRGDLLVRKLFRISPEQVA